MMVFVDDLANRLLTITMAIFFETTRITAHVKASASLAACYMSTSAYIAIGMRLEEKHDSARKGAFSAYMVSAT